jgi:hypothetical protein
VLAGDRAPGVDARLHHVAHRRVHARALVRVARVVADVRVQVAVAGVEDVADAHTVRGADGGDARQHVGQPRARHHRILQHEVRGDAPHRPERLLAPLPQSRALGGIGRDGDVARAGGATEGDAACDVLVQPRRGPVDLAQEHGRRIGRIAGGVDRRLDRLDRARVHHLERGGHDAGGDDARHRARGILETREVGEQRAHRFGIGRQPDGDVEGDAEASLAADERAEQIVAAGLAVGVAQRDDLAIGEHHRDRGHVVERHPVLEAVGAARVLRHVAADRARALAGRIGRVVQSERRHGARQRDVHDPRLDHRQPVLRIDRQDARQPVEPEDHDAVGERATREPGARAAGDERGVVRGERADDRDQLVARPGKDGQRRSPMIAGEPVRIVHAQLARALLHVPAADERGQRVDQRGRDGRRPGERRAAGRHGVRRHQCGPWPLDRAPTCTAARASIGSTARVSSASSSRSRSDADRELSSR